MTRASKDTASAGTAGSDTVFGDEVRIPLTSFLHRPRCIVIDYGLWWGCLSDRIHCLWHGLSSIALVACICVHPQHDHLTLNAIMQNHFSEIHVLVHALNGDVLEPDTMQHTCEYIHDVFAEQVRTGICISQGTVWSIDAATRNLTDLANVSSIAPTAAPLPASLFNPTDTYRDSTSDSSSASEAPVPTAEAQLFADVLASEAPLYSVFDEAFSPDSAAQEIIDSAPIECIPPFSIFNVRETIKQLGYGLSLIHI